MKNKDVISPSKVSDFLLTECREKGDLLTNLKLQKLLYYAQAWHLALKNIPLFDEDFQAWVHGPVLPSQYHRFKSSEWKPILNEITKPKIDDENLNSHLIEVVDVFGAETAIALELMTHSEAPWKEARHGIAVDKPSKEIITKESMREFYQNMK